MQLITFKLKEDYLKKLDFAVKAFDYSSRTEFIRTAIRDKLEAYELKKSIDKLKKLKGFAKNAKVSDSELEALREKVFEELYPKLK
ncbi:ribbon-helix-helix protein, CopG family [archaeon]|nr:ribbon-helix-helix protein, CopG family [archaeon]